MSILAETPVNKNRFRDNTTAVPIDRRRVLGFAPGIVNMEMEVDGSGQQSRFIPQGTLVVFKPHVDTVRDADWKKMPYERPAMRFAENVQKCFKDGEGGDQGFRILDFLTDLPYNKETGYDEADFYFAIVHPPLHAIGLRCDMGLESEPAAFNLDPNGQPIPMPCPTCRIKWLESPECKAAIEQVTNLDKGKLETLRITLLGSYRAGYEFNRQRLADVDTDIANRKSGQPGRGAWDTACYAYAKAIHRKPEHIQQAEITANVAEIQGKAIGQAIAGQNAPVDPTAGMSPAEKAEYWQEQAEFAKWKEERARMSAAPVDEPVSELSSIASGRPVRVLADGREGKVAMKPGGKYVVEFGPDDKATFTRTEIEEVKDE